MFQKHGKSAYKKDLENTLKLARIFNSPQDKFKSIHIAGTNGKGSSAHMAAAILQAQGLKVGLYTSPHLYSFRERIKINGEMVEESFVVDFVDRCKSFIEEEKPSFFEVTTIMAFDYFASQEVDYAVIEVGLGGRLDCTNIITPELSIITSIGLDHIDILGDDIQGIAKEKAGIIKQGVPVCFQESEEKVIDVFESVAKENNSAFYKCLSKDVEIFKDTLPLKGEHQLKNLASVVKGLSLLEGVKTNNELISKGFELMENGLNISGRWEVLQEEPKVVLDTAHNVDAIKALLAQIEKEEYDNLIFVLAFMQDKEVIDILSLLPRTVKYYFASFKHPRALYATHLKEMAKSKGMEGDEYGKVELAYKTAVSKAGKKDLVIVTGSNFIAERLKLI